jgi:hypothetical protein
MVEPAAISAIVVSVLTALSGIALGLHFHFNTHCGSCCQSECMDNTPPAPAPKPPVVRFAPTAEVKVYDV